MKIDLKLPYSKEYKAGYVYINRDDRKTLYLVKHGESHTSSSTSYARYLYAVSIGEYVDPSLQIDHINGDKTDDRLDNLQALSLQDNHRKTSFKGYVKLTCPHCSTVFYRTNSELRGRKHKIESNQICCSRYCGGAYGNTQKNK